MIRKTILFLSILVLLSSYVSATDTCFYPSGIPRCQAAECNTIFPVAGSWSYESNSCQDFGDSVAVYYDAVCDNTEPVFNAVVPGTNARTLCTK